MQIGIPAEIRTGETRVAATPETVKKYAQGGHHKVLVQAGAGMASSYQDADYVAAGATIVS
ncbi:MAG: NAD(P)(+) transhydrogenase (Re/Si-specific) subunit alpha, partial [Betaproteobacteria bacterium]|nr:NAD(P)(+) transhydrogenase (Re/Si-specific) subunit alpha [Betaproteobacteria bacterium]